MADIINCDSELLKLREITSLHSQANSREIINENFRKLRQYIECMVGDINVMTNILPPVPPVIGQSYVIYFDGTNYIMIPFSAGTKYRIRSNERIFVGEDYQYLLYGHIIIEGTFDMEAGAELVIL